MQFKQWIKFIGTALLATTFAVSSQAAIWSSSEVHYSTGGYLNFGTDKHDVTRAALLSNMRVVTSMARISFLSIIQDLIREVVFTVSGIRLLA